MLLSGAALPAPSVLHAVMQMRARVMIDDSAQTLQRLNGGTSSPLLADRVAALYGGARWRRRCCVNLRARRLRLKRPCNC